MPWGNRKRFAFLPLYTCTQQTESMLAQWQIKHFGLDNFFTTDTRPLPSTTNNYLSLLLVITQEKKECTKSMMIYIQEAAS